MSSYRLSEPQRGIYYSLQFQGHSQIYYVLAISALKGPVNAVLFEKANALVHHTQPALRVVFEETDTGPMQVIREQVEPDFEVVDLSHMDEDQQEAYQQDLLKKARAYEFDLGRDVLYRSKLLKLGDARYAWFMQVHHVICDAWGISVLYNETSRLYSALLADPNYHEAPNMGFFEYLAFEEDYLKSNRFEADRSYWQDKINRLEPFPLERAFPRPKKSYAAIREARLLPQSEAIYAWCETHKVSLYSFFCGVIGTYLHQISGLNHLALGVSVLNRPRKSHKSAVGMLSNFIPLVMDLESPTHFLDLVQQIGLTSKRDFRHQRHPIHEILTARKMTESQLLPVQFNYQTSDYGTHFGDVEHNPIWHFAEAEEHVLTFNINDFQSGGIEFSLDYSTDTFDDIDYIWARLNHLINDILADDKAFEHLNCLPPAEFQELQDFSRGSQHWQRPTTHVCEAFEAMARLRANCTALENRQEIWTYAMFKERACQFANGLQALGTKHQDKVLMALQPSMDAIAAIWGIWMRGAVYIPVAGDIPTKRLEAIVTEAKPQAIIAEEAIVDGPLPCLTPQTIENEATSLNQEAQYSLDDMAYVIYTSGSTGKPKGIINSHRSLAYYTAVFNQTVGLSHRDTMAQQASLTFDTSLEEIIPILCEGGTVFILERDLLLEGRGLWQELENQGISCLSTTPGVIGLMNEDVPQKTPLRILISGGAALHPANYANLCHKTRVYNSYGPTETTICASYAEVSNGPHNLGQPLPGCRIFLVDPAGQPVPIGVTGEIAIAGLGMSQGYLQKPALTAQRFGPNPWSQGPHDSVLYRSGDLGKWDRSGRLHFAGRADRQLKIRGFRIEPEEIEASLERHPQIRKAAIQTSGGNENLQLTAHLETSQTITVSEIRSYLATSLPEYMIPWRYQFHDALPLNHAGKIHYQALVEADAAPDELLFEALQSPIEADIASLWAEILGHPIENRHANFFAEGGHSLKATRLLRAIENHWGIKPKLGQIFEKPVLFEQAELIASQSRQQQITIPVLNTDTIPLSHAQERLWLLQNQAPDNSAYHISLALKLEGDLDLSRFKEAVQTVIDRHEVLRTNFENSQYGPIQQVQKPSAIQWNEGHLSADRTDSVLKRLVLPPFDLSRDALVRHGLWQLEDNQILWVIVFHHIVADAWSVDIVLNEILSLYNNPQSVLMEPFQSRHFAAWQRSLAGVDAYAKDLEYWLQRMTKPATPLDLPTLKPRTNNQRPAQSLCVEIPQASLKAFDQWVAQNKATRFMGLQAALTLLLHHYTGASHIPIGTPYAARDYAQLENSIGFFANTLVLESKLQPQKTLNTLLGQIRQDTLAAFEHGSLPFDRLVEATQTGFEVSRTPLFDVMLVLLNTADGYAGLNGIQRVQRLQTPVRHAKCDWLFSFRQDQDRLFLDFEYDADLYSLARAKSVANHFLHLLRKLPNQGNRPLKALELTDSIPCDNPIDYQALSISQGFAAQARTYPQRIILKDSRNHWSYQELFDAVETLAGQLYNHHSIRPGDVVAVASDRPAESILVLLSCLRLGAVYLPIDPEWPDSRCRFVLEDSRCQILVAHTRFDWAGSMTHVSLHQLPHTPMRAPRFKGSANHPAYLLYTSGSTGTPKAVLQTQGCLNQLIEWQVENLADPGPIMQFAASTFDVFLQETLFALCSGSPLCIPLKEDRQDLSALARWMHDNAIETAFLPYTALKTLCELGKSMPLSGLRHVITAGEALVITDGIKTFLKEHPQITLHNHYGPTETHVVTAFALRHGPSMTNLPPIGSPIGETRLRVCDAWGNPLPVGAKGELWVSGAAVALGYWRRSSLTASQFVPALHSEARWYRTGDLVHCDEQGLYHFHGRIDTQVKVRGFRVECGEIETILMNHPAIENAVVVPDQADGELNAWYTGAAAIAGLKSYVADHLPHYMQPRQFFWVEDLPMSSSGKVDRKQLRMGQFQIHSAETEPIQDFEPSTSPMERLLAKTWREVLGLSFTPGPEHHFFDLGGHSIRANRLVMQLAKEQGLEIPMRWIFNYPLLGDLAAQIEDHRVAGHFIAIPKRTAQAHYPLSQAQRQIWLACQNPVRSLAYHIPAVLRLSGQLDLAVLSKAFTALIAGHEGLRTRFITHAGQPVQIVDEHCEVELACLEITGDLTFKVRDFLEQAFDLENGPLLRASVFNLMDSEQPQTLLAVVFHHLIADGWSLDLLMKDLMSNYQAGLNGEAMQTAAESLNYADFAVWEQQLDKTSQKRRKKIAPLFEPPLEADPNQPFQGQTDRFFWDIQALQNLEACARRCQTTLYAVLAAGLMSALHRHTQQSEIALGMPTAGRLHPDTHAMVGTFVRTLPLVETLAGEQSFDDLLISLKNKLMAHLEKPVHETDVAIQVVLVLQNTSPADLDWHLPQVDIALEPIFPRTSRLDLSVNVRETEDGLEFLVEYDCRRFTEDDIALFMGRWQQLMETASSQGFLALASLPFQTSAETAQEIDLDLAFDF